MGFASAVRAAGVAASRLTLPTIRVIARRCSDHTRALARPSALAFLDRFSHPLPPDVAAFVQTWPTRSLQIDDVFRDYYQNSGDKDFSLETLEEIARLSACLMGPGRVELGSFIREPALGSPHLFKRMNYMATLADKLVRFPEESRGLFHALVAPHVHHFRRFSATATFLSAAGVVLHPSIPLTANPIYAARNLKMSPEMALKGALDGLSEIDPKLSVVVYFSGTHGVNGFPGDYLNEARQMFTQLRQTNRDIYFNYGDTTGEASPKMIRKVIQALLEDGVSADHIYFHFHFNPRWSLRQNLILLSAKVGVAMAMGVRKFDCNAFGEGGSPLNPQQGPNGNVGMSYFIGLAQALNLSVNGNLGSVEHRTRFLTQTFEYQDYLNERLAVPVQDIVATHLQPAWLVDGLRIAAQTVSG
ncbi:MAG: hypothetical protein AB7F28_03805 [Candidatus Margulisiibacteriota bacterium]